jgi:hypothetical protein
MDESHVAFNAIPTLANGPKRIEIISLPKE